MATKPLEVREPRERSESLVREDWRESLAARVPEASQ